MDLEVYQVEHHQRQATGHDNISRELWPIGQEGHRHRSVQGAMNLGILCWSNLVFSFLITCVRAAGLLGVDNDGNGKM